MSICFLFPGQGAQYPGMLHKLPQHPAIESTLDQASKILKLDVHELDSEQALHSTVSVQLSLFIAGVAVANMLETEGIIPMAATGLSIGAYAAAVTCKSLSFADGIAVVQKRAQLMEDGFPSGYGMYAIVGLTEQRVAQLVNQFHCDAEPVFLSNINAQRQITISGSLKGMKKIAAAALSSGASKAEKLNIDVPSHCALFQPAADILQEILEKIGLKDPAIPYIGNIRARPIRTAAGVATDLANNIANGVRWYDSIALLRELGTNLFIEINPGNVLTRLGSESFPHARFIAFEDSSIAYMKRLTN